MRRQHREQGLGGEFARLYTTALSGLVDTPYVKSTGRSVQISLPRSAELPETSNTSPPAPACTGSVLFVTEQ